MTRRVIIGHRGNGEVGIFVSKPGIDAAAGNEGQMLFSAVRRHFMMVQSGWLQVPGGEQSLRINFAVPPGQPPLVLCGHFNGNPTEMPVGASSDADGFTVWPLYSVAHGGWPAAGTWVPYFAFLKSQ